MNKISIIIPVFNEKNTLGKVIESVKSADTLGIEKEIIIVDDGSTDGTKQILEKKSSKKLYKIITNEQNLGKGAALKKGFAVSSGDIVIIQDADLEYNPKEYSNLIEPILDGRAGAVYGSRFLGGPHRVLFFWHYVGNKILTTLSNMLTNLNLTDMETCYKVFKADVIKNINIRSNRFGFEPEITAKLAKRKCVIYELPVSYSGRDYVEGKKIGWKDGIVALYCIIRFRLFD